MCLAALALDCSRRFPFVVAANRDEFFHRPAARLGWWQPEGGGPPILGGRDLQAGGTWMGLTAAGRFGLVTNVRRGLPTAAEGPSRGLIVPDWLRGDEPPHRFWARTALSGHSPFNLLAADFRLGECFWASNDAPHPRRLGRGVTAISNAAAWNAPWPKIQALKVQVESVLREAEPALATEALASLLFALLADRTPAADDDLPSTGIGLEKERMLSPAFIRSPDGTYGTRCSTLVITERLGRQLLTHVFERSFTNGPGRVRVRRSTLKDWPPRRLTGGAMLPGYKARTISACAMPASSNTGPRCEKPARR